MNVRQIYLIALSLFFSFTLCGKGIQPIIFVGEENNDLFSAMRENGVATILLPDLNAALQDASKGQGIIVSAPGYPEKRSEITPEQFSYIAKKGIRLFIEYPSCLYRYDLPSEFNGKLERGVVTTSVFGTELPELSILGLNGVRMIDCRKVSGIVPLISFAKVAGFDHAEFGLDGVVAYPLLFRAGKNIMVSSTKLTSFKKARYAPLDSWKIVFDKILQWVSGSEDTLLSELCGDPTPSYGENDPLPSDARTAAVRKGAEWLWNARLLIHPTWAGDYIKQYQPEGGNPNHFFGPPISCDMLVGDGDFGVMEGHASEIGNNGVQKYRYFIRADVQGEAAMLLASASKLCNDSHYAETSERILDYLFYTSDFRGDSRNDKASPSYGLIGWSNTHLGAFFNDDNARCILGVIGASAFLDNQRWNNFIVENIFANLRTCSRQGFQGGSLNEQDIISNGWRYYNDRDYTNPHPHFESWMWACYLWLYDKCGFEPLLQKAKDGIRIMMEAYPDNWHVQNGMQQERARMVLPLAWLYRLEPTKEHYDWLKTIVDALLECQEPCGAVREELGRSDQDKNRILVSSNEAYGKNEAPLIAKNGEPVSDMLYTCNFLFFALNEAASATENKEWKEAVQKLGDFLVRIQVRSDNHKDLNGAWFRAFDFGRWDYWASNADDGWGAWSTLAGWIQSWIVTTEALLEEGTSYWEQTKNMDMTEAVHNCLWMVNDI